MYNKVELSGIQTSCLPRLSREETEEMLRQIKQGDEEKKKLFIRCNLRLVLSVVQKFSRRSDNLDDIFQVGCIGLIKAIDNFDFTFNVRFSTYAVPMIIGEIRRHLRDSSTLRVSRTLKDIAYKALKVKEIANNDNLSNTEIAGLIGVSEKLLVEALDAACEPYSLFESFSAEKGDEFELIEQIKDNNNNEDSWIEKIALNIAVNALNSKEKEIINNRYYKGKSQVEVAKQIGISQAQVSRIEKNAIEKMKKYFMH